MCLSSCIKLGICLLFVVVGLGVYFGVTGQTPTVDVESVKLECQTNEGCELEDRAYLKFYATITNKNPIGAHVSAKYNILDSNKESKTYNTKLCEGSVDKTWINKNAETQIQGQCQIINQTLFKGIIIAFNNDVKVEVNGKISLDFFWYNIPFSQKMTLKF